MATPAGILLPLRSAHLCANCEVLSDATGDTCPKCGSASLMSLAAVLGTLQTEQSTPTLLTEGADNHGRSPSHIAE